MKLQGKTALVTGGGAGIGAAITRRFVEEGARVCITGRRREVLDKTVQAFPQGSVMPCAGDVSKDEDVDRMVETTVKFGGALDILVNNAGINRHGPVAELDRAVWHEVMGVNLHGPFMLMQEAIPHMTGAALVIDAGTAVVDVVGASITGSLRRGGL